MNVKNDIKDLKNYHKSAAELGTPMIARCRPTTPHGLQLRPPMENPYYSCKPTRVAADLQFGGIMMFGIFATKVLKRPLPTGVHMKDLVVVGCI